MTPIEFRREMAAFAERRRDEHERIITAAWFTVAIENEMHANKRLKSLSQTIEQFLPRQRPDAVKKPAPSDIAGQLSWLGIPKKPMSDETRAAMWTPKVPANG